MKKKLISIFLTLLTVISLSALPTSAAENTKITKCLDIALENTDLEGPGYTWDNIKCVMEMDGFVLNTTDMYGIKFPAHSKVILKGDNYVTASAYGIHCLSSLEFSGDGTLTIVAPDAGIICVSTNATDNVRFQGGTVKISGGKKGIYSENAKLSFTGGKVTIDASEYSLFGNNVQMTGGTHNFKGTVHAKAAVEITDTTLSITASNRAINALGGTNIKGKSILAGENTSTLSEIEQYNGQACLRVIPQGKKGEPSMLFGEGVSPVWDYVIFALITVAVVAVITVPMAIKHRKTAKLIALSEQNKKASGKKGSK